MRLRRSRPLLLLVVLLAIGGASPAVAGDGGEHGSDLGADRLRTVPAATALPSTPFDRYRAMRAELGFPSDAATVTALMNRPDVDMSLGFPLLPTELAEVEARQELGGDAATVKQVLTRQGISYSGIYIDNRADGLLTVVVPHASDALVETLKGAVDHPARLVVRQARYTLAQLDEFKARVWAASGTFASRGVQLRATGIDVPRNQIYVGVSDDLGAAREVLDSLLPSDAAYVQQVIALGSD